MALWQAYDYTTLYDRTVKLDNQQIIAEVDSGNFSNLSNLIALRQVDEQSLLNTAGTSYTAYYILNSTASFLAKLQHTESSTESIAANYARDKYYAYLTLGSIYTGYNYLDSVVTTYSNPLVINQIGYNECNYYVSQMQTTLQPIIANNFNLQYIISDMGPSSFTKKLLVDDSVTYNAMNLVYPVLTGNSPVTKNQTYDICDYANFQQTLTDSNPVSMGINNALHKASLKTGISESSLFYWSNILLARNISNLAIHFKQ